MTTDRSSQSDRPIRALILDLGNVLIFHDNNQLYRELAAACGCPPAQVRATLQSAEMRRRINLTDGPPRTVYDSVAPAIGFPGDLAAFESIWNGIFRLNEPVFPVIEALHGSVPLLVLSNTNPMHMAYIRPRLPVLRRFEAVLTSHELGLMKPDHAIYEAALAAAGVPAAEAAFFDDLPGHVEGAEQAGLRGFLFNDLEQFTTDLTTLGLWPGTLSESQ